MRVDGGARITPRLVTGLAVVGLGLLFLLHELIGFEVGRVLRYWPIALIVFGSTILWEGGWYGRQRPPGRRQSGVWGLFWIAAGSWFLLDTLDCLRPLFGWIRFDPWTLFWPLLLLVVGASIVWRSLRGPRPARETAPHLEQTFSAFALMSGVGLRNASQEFRGGEATAVMGGCDIDLRDARIAGGEAVIDVFALWGGVDVKVPEGWNVVSDVMPLMGGYEDNTRPPAGGEGPESQRPRLVIKGFAIMGGIEVSNK